MNLSCKHWVSTLLLLWSVVALYSQQVQVDTMKSIEVEAEARKKKKFKIEFPKLKKDSSGEIQMPIVRKTVDFVQNIELPPVREIIHPNKKKAFPNQEVLDSTMETLESALIHFEDVGDTMSANIIRETVGAIHQSTGDQKYALESYEEVLRIAERSHDKEGIARAKMNIANVLVDRKEYERAHRFYSDALRLAEELLLENENAAIKAELPLLHVQLGKCCQELNREGEALRHFNQAIALGDATGNKEDRSYAYTNMGEFYSKKKDWAQAENFHRKAFEELDFLKNDYGKAVELNHLGRLYLEKGDLRKAETFLEQSLELGRRGRSQRPGKRCLPGPFKKCRKTR